MEGAPRKVDSRAFFYTGQTIKTTSIAVLRLVTASMRGGRMQKQPTAESGSLILEWEESTAPKLIKITFLCKEYLGSTNFEFVDRFLEEYVLESWFVEKSGSHFILPWRRYWSNFLEIYWCIFISSKTAVFRVIYMQIYCKVRIVCTPRKATQNGFYTFFGPKHHTECKN
jgi:hypothetical protein